MNSVHARELDRQFMIRLKESLIDADILVDDARRELDAAVERLQLTVKRRDALAVQLKAQIDKLEAAA